MMNYATITNAGILILIVGWTFVGSIITWMVMTHYVDRVGFREYQRGHRDGSGIR
jgi:hypothetical protein